MKSKDQFNDVLWNRLLAHHGHKLVVAKYGDPESPANVSLECEDCGEVVLDAELYTICAKRDGTERQDLRVETPLGVLFAGVQGDHDHPGIQIGLHSQTANQDLLLTLVEFCEDEGDLPDGKHCIITRVWDEAMQDEYAYRHIHKGIEDFFKSEDAPEPTKSYTVYLSQLQYGNVTVEATSKKEAEEKARALYKQGGVEWHDDELTDLEASEEPARKPLEAGYHKEAVTEPLILEPEDWSRQEWATLCKLCGLPADRAERIVLHVGEMESYIGKEG